MNLLFVHDHVFKFKGEIYYSSGGFPSSVWARYLLFFDSLTVVGRNGGVLSDEGKGCTVTSTHGVSFSLLPSMSNLNSLLFSNKETNSACQDLVAKHDAVVARVPSRLGTLFVKEAIKQKKPYAVEVVACPWDALWNYGNWQAKAVAPFAFLNLRRIVRNSSHTLYVTERFLQGRYPSLARRTVACSNVKIPEVSADVIACRIAKIIDTSKPVVFGLIGNYSSRYKGIDVAIRALAKANAYLPGWEFQILGKGDSARYKQLACDLGISDKVKFVGGLAAGQPVFQWLDSVDIYLHPSRVEGVPRALVEAMSRGCPAIASSVGGIPELLPAAVLHPAGDVRRLAALIEAAIAPGFMKKYAVRNWERAKDFRSERLDAVRNEFLSAFAEEARARKSLSKK